MFQILGDDNLHISSFFDSMNDCFRYNTNLFGIYLVLYQFKIIRNFYVTNILFFLIGGNLKIFFLYLCPPSPDLATQAMFLYFR